MNPNTENRIRDRAYFLWEADGRPEGHDKDYWERAEREMSEKGELDLSEADSTVDRPPVQAGLPVHYGFPRMRTRRASCASFSPA